MHPMARSRRTLQHFLTTRLLPVRKYSNYGSSIQGKISVLGASGPTGLELVKEALLQGYEVKALVRNPDKLAPLNKQIAVEKVNIFKPDDLAGHMHGSVAIISSLGAPASLLAHSPCTLYSQSMKVMAEAMRKAGVHRFVCVNSWCTKYTPGSPKIIEWFSRPLYLRNILSDMSAMEDFLKYHCGDINYTVVRAPGLSNGPSTGKRIKAKQGQYLKHVSLTMPRRDVAKFMLSTLKTQEWDKKCVAIGI